MTGEEFAPIWTSLLEAWPTAKVRQGSSRLYLSKLASFTADEVRAAVDQAICNSDFFPSVAMLWQRCIATRDGAPGWDQAWREATAAAAAWQPGATEQRTWPYSHQAIKEAVRVIGAWELKTGDNTPALRAQFRDAYLEILARRRAAYATGQRVLPPPQPQRPNMAGSRQSPPTRERNQPSDPPERPVGELITALADNVQPDDGHPAVHRGR